MTPAKPSPTRNTFLIGIEAPQSVSVMIFRKIRETVPAELIASPLPPLLPLLQTHLQPSPPVPGLLPHCPGAPVPAPELQLSGESPGGIRWLLWPVEASTWYSRLREALLPLHDMSEDRPVDPGAAPPEPLFPFDNGIPLGVVNGGASWSSRPPVFRQMPVTGWRALNLVCWSVEYLEGRPWYMSAAWYPLWRRRLKRAPESTNNNKQPELA